MQHILVRSGEDPLRPMAPKTKAVRTTAGNNFGNLLFSAAAHKLLSGRGREVVSHGTDRFEPSNPGEINERFDVLVLPFANAFRPGFERRLLQYADLIEQLEIPVVVLGIGAQSTLDYSLEELRPLESTIRRFMRATLERSASVGVRGEFTAAYLKHLGFPAVEVVGCPSMFMNGEELRVGKELDVLPSSARLALNASPAEGMGEIVDRHAARYPNLRYLCQDREELQLLLWGRAFEPAETGGATLPSDVTHPLYRNDRMRMCADPWTWIDYLRTFDFAFGARIHGNIAALLAGTPAYVLAHDSRTLELARYFEIPHARMDRLPPDVDAATLYEETDLTGLHRGHAARFEQFVDFLTANGLPCIFSDPADVLAWEARVAKTRFPPPVRPAEGLAGTSISPGMRQKAAKLDRKLRARLERWNERTR
jgi:hypothetical protein